LLRFHFRKTRKEWDNLKLTWGEIMEEWMDYNFCKEKLKEVEIPKI
jgi:hypothetical protein